VTLTRNEYLVARERTDLLEQPETPAEHEAELPEDPGIQCCPGCGKEFPSGSHGRKWCSQTCSRRARQNRAAAVAPKPRKRTAGYRPPGKRAANSSNGAGAVSSTNSAIPVHSEISLDRLLDALGADVATVTIATRAGIELVVRL
jgi:hypothetical protein